MKQQLKDFQERAVEDLLAELRRASIEVKDSPRRGQATWLTAPTGSGKTLIATAVIERLLQGTQAFPPMRTARFLWLSDNPELNEQTRKKMLTTSSFGPGDLVVIGSGFDEEFLPPGRVHFLNIQKVAKDTTLVARGDKRTYTIWQTLANTVARSPHELFLFIDEAHRGTTERASAVQEAVTITQKFIKGSEADGLPPIPVIAGISATPERFQRLIVGTGRVQRPVDVPPEDVRASGLLKEFIDLLHPSREGTADITLLKRAAVAWHESSEKWRKYCAKSGDPLVRPILVVQVEDGTTKMLTKTDLEQCVRTIRDAVGKAAEKLLPEKAFAHAFQEDKPAPLGTAHLRHLKPSDIVDDPDVRVVFFKTSLNTGWDCPQAEVMMSFRTALDATSIAQLVGRMVRTPLARHIETDESLNAVALYLPHYDTENLDKVVEKLTGDPDTGLAVEVRRGEDVVDLARAKKSEKLFAALTDLPSYVVPKSRRVPEVKRLMKFAFLLANDALDADATDTAAATLLSVLRTEHGKRKDTEQFKEWLESAASVRVGGRRVRLGVAEEGPLGETTASRAAEDIEDEFEEAGRRLGEGLHKLWWRSRVEVDGVDRETAKLEAIALSADASIVAALDTAAQAQTQAWLRQHKRAIGELPEAAHHAYMEVKLLASKPELIDREPYPDRIQVTKAERWWSEHVYVDDKARYPSKLNKWERKVIDRALSKKGEVLGWLRNPPRKGWSLTVPYRRGGEDHPQYPDFIVLRKGNGGEILVDILEPHMTDLADAAAKVLGLANYADLHADQFDRIEFIIVVGDDIVSLDLMDERWRKKVLVFAEGGDSAKLEELLNEVRAAPPRS